MQLSLIKFITHIESRLFRKGEAHDDFRNNKFDYLYPFFDRDNRHFLRHLLSSKKRRKKNNGKGNKRNSQTVHNR